MTAKEYDDSLGDIVSTLKSLYEKLEKNGMFPLNGVNQDHIIQAWELLSDLKAYNAMPLDHPGSFIDIEKARRVNRNYESRFTRIKAKGNLPLFRMKVLTLNADRLRLLTNLKTKTGELASTIQIYPGLVTTAEDSSEKEDRLTLIFAALDKNDLPIRNENLSDESRQQINEMQPKPPGSKTDSPAPQYDVLDEIGTCKPPASCSL